MAVGEGHQSIGVRFFRPGHLVDRQDNVLKAQRGYRLIVLGVVDLDVESVPQLGIPLRNQLRALHTVLFDVGDDDNIVVLGHPLGQGVDSHGGKPIGAVHRLKLLERQGLFAQAVGVICFPIMDADQLAVSRPKEVHLHGPVAPLIGVVQGLQAVTAHSTSRSDATGVEDVLSPVLHNIGRPGLDGQGFHGRRRG